MINIKTCECGKEIIFLLTKNGKNSPTLLSSLSDEERKLVEDMNNGKVEENREAILFDPPRHLSHFIDCPFSKSFKKKSS